jgi:mono/diheme cytochrome c family protein
VRLLLILALAGPFSAPFARAAGDPEKGRAIATKHCSRCHVVGDHNPTGGIGSTPSFQVLRTMKDWRERFESFYARRPHPVHVRVHGLPTLTELPPNAAPFTLTIADVDHILSFAETIAPAW